MANPCALPKAIKTIPEIADIKCAAQRDSVALINLLHWTYLNHANGITELQVAEKALYFRKMQLDFVGESFRCIAAADENSAIVHYSPDENSNKKIEKILLLDSGGQYKYGTTDITRTVCFSKPTDERKMLYTLVLKGHIAVASAKLPSGSTGSQLDPLARQFLWNSFLNYNHSTGHGIGYMADVHEGPMAIAKSNYIQLRPGMLLSNEPGSYMENDFGIRLENMMVVTSTQNCFLEFETISLVPFDINFIAPQLLTEKEIAWINDYHRDIINRMAGKLSPEVAQWLRHYCSAIPQKNTA
jgi:Xaa-Pro aminopeptidase